MAIGGLGRTVNIRAICRLLDIRLMSEARSSLLVPPASVRGMKELNRDAFAIAANVQILRLDHANLATVMPSLKRYLLKLPNFKPVQSTEAGKIAYLDPEKVREFSDIDDSVRSLLADNEIGQLEERQVDIRYENWRSDQIFRGIFPDGVEVPTSFSRIGHIVHLNLRDEQLPYKNLIGQVLLDKIPNSRTVVNKLNQIDTTYRHFAMEILAGDSDTLATVVENGCRYTFDFATVYWNPRLGTEHETLVAFLKPGDVLYDVFAGVGPFAIPAARKGVRVLANDLNPESHRWLVENAKANKAAGNIRTFNKDGRDFLRDDVRCHLLARRSDDAAGTEHLAMNLPAMALEFLDVFQEWSSDADTISSKPPVVHVYFFVKIGKDEDPCDSAKSLVEETLGCTLSPESLVTIRHVRNVAPAKEMMRVSFRLTRDILVPDEPKAKKLKSENLSVGRHLVIGKDGKEQGNAQDEKCVQGRRST